MNVSIRISTLAMGNAPIYQGVITAHAHKALEETHCMKTARESQKTSPSRPSWL